VSDTFDPNQPYQEVDQSQAFDPSQPYQEVAESQPQAPTEPDLTAMREHAKINLKARERANNAPTADGAKPKREPIDISPKPVPAESFAESLAAGIGMSVSGLMTAGRPVLSVTDHENTMYHIGSMIGQVVGDLPFMLGGMVGGATGGAIGGAAVGTAAGPGIGTIVGMGAGSVAGGYFGAGALPAGIRKLYMDHYEKGDIQDSKDFANRVMAASWEAIKGGTLNVAMMGAGSQAKALTAGAKPFVTSTAGLMAELNTMAIGSAALEGRLPKLEDFTNAGIMLGGVHGLTAAVPKLVGIFKATGEHPADIVEATSKDPVLKQEMAAANPDLPRIEVPPEAEAAAQPEPPAEGEEPKPLTEEQHQAQIAVEVAKEARAKQEQAAGYPDAQPEIEPEAPAQGPELSDEVKHILNFVGEKEPRSLSPIKELTAAFKKDITHLLKSEDTANSEHFESATWGLIAEHTANLYERYFDMGKAMGRMMRDVMAHPEASNNPQILIRLFSEISTKVRGFMDEAGTAGTRDFKTQDINGESLGHIYRDVREADPEDPQMHNFRAYMIAKRVVEKARQGMKIIVRAGEGQEGEAIDLDTAQKVVEELGPKYEAFNQRRIAYRNRILQYVHDSGYWTPEQFEAMKAANEDYASFHRVQETDPLFGGGRSKSSRGVYRMKGKGGLIVDPILSDWKDTDMLIRLAEENRIKQATVNTLATGDDATAWLRKVEPKTQVTEVTGEEITKHLQDSGLETGDETADGMRVFRRSHTPLTDNQIDVYVDGKREVYEGPRETIEIIRALRGIEGPSGLFAQLLKLPAAGIRAGTIYAYAFAGKHSFRNQIVGGTYSNTGVIPFVTPALYALDQFAKPGTPEATRWANFLNDGGAQSSFTAMDDQWYKSKIFDLEEKAPFFGKAWNLIKTAAQASHAMILAADNSTRYAEYARSLEKGASRIEAANAARRVLPDVAAQGVARSFWLTQTAFLGIHVKSMVRSGEALMEQSESTKAALERGEISEALKGPLSRSIGMITLPAALAAAYTHLTGQDEKIRRLLPWQKNGYFNIPIPKWEKATPEEAASMPHADLRRQLPDGSWEIDHGITFRMQMPFTQGVFFGGAVQASIDSFREKSPKAFSEWAKNVGESTLALPLPNVADPTVAQVTNYQPFTGQPLIPDNKLHLVPELQYEPYTTETAKALGKLVGHVPYLGKTSFASPIVVEEYVRDWTGPIGLTALKIADQALIKATGKRVAPQPEWEWADYPIIGAFVWRNDTAKTQDIDNFTKAYMRGDSVLKSVKELNKEQATPEVISEFQQDHREELQQRMQGPYMAIRQMKHYIQAVTADPTYDAKTKRQLIEPVYYQMDEIAKQANKQIDDMKKSMHAQGSAGE
jgi:hypothetical protein